MLEVRALTARYGDSRVLHGIDFDLPAGRVLTLLGRNGAARTSGWARTASGVSSAITWP